MNAAMDLTDCSPMLRHYRALGCASAEMLQAARQGDWDSVCRLEAACVVLVARLRSLADEHASRPHEQAERMRILRTILVNDAEIRRIADPLPPVLQAAPVLAYAPSNHLLH